MRRALLLCVATLLLAIPAWAQNTDIESLSGLQFNFGNPGARSLGMGGAFLGLADDATAAEANPAGLTILRKAEFSIEGRNYLEQQVLTTSGTFPDLVRTGFNHHSDRVQVSFASAVIPVKDRFTLGVYYHQPLRNVGAGQVLPQTNEFSGQVEADVPRFFLPRGGTPVSQQECQDIVRQTNDFFSCLEFTINPFISAVDVDLRTWGFAGAWQVHPRLSLGATVRYQTFKESSLTFRVTPDFQFDSISAQSTGRINDAGEIEETTETDLTYTAGFKWSPTDKISFGGVYKVGGEFDAPTFFASADTDFQFITAAQTKFHIPDTAGLGVSIRPIPTLTINVDAVHVKYSNLVDDFFSLSESVRELDNPYEAKDVTEIRVGGEYFFPTRVPFALRAGYFRDPKHSTRYAGPLDTFERVAEAVLFPEGEDQDYYSVGAGLAWPRFQIDAAYQTSERYKVGSISVVPRF